MYPVVEIEGSLTPCTFLPTGERRTVALTDTIAKFIDKGYVNVVGTPEEVWPEDHIELVDAEPPQQRPAGVDTVRGYQRRIAKHG